MTHDSGESVIHKLRAEGNGSKVEKLGFLIATTMSLALAHTISATFINWALGFGIAIFVVDLLSAGVHWYFDNHIRPGSGFLGKIAVDFHDHHVEPQRTVDVGFIKSAIRPALFVMLPLSLIAVVIIENGFLAALIWSIGFLSMLVPQMHKLAHVEQSNALVKMLQTKGLILNPVSHSRHHTPPYTSAYCVFTGWLNPLLDKAGFWERMDRLVCLLHLRF